jgi:protein dithiol oxidoreductase (disulfide-forming)
MSKRMRIPGFLLLLAALGSAAALPVQAAPPPGAIEGADYRVIPSPQPTGTPGKIEVLEFFSYGCPHCNEFYPLVSAWAGKLPKDVVFNRVPVGFGRPAWVNLARAYYALKASGDFDKLDGALFHGLHEENLNLTDEGSLADWVGRQGGHADKFAAAYTSFGVNNETEQADEMVQNYTVDAVPTLAIDGRYIVLGDSFPQILKNADKVIAMVRAQSKPAAKPATAAR